MRSAIDWSMSLAFVGSVASGIRLTAEECSEISVLLAKTPRRIGEVVGHKEMGLGLVQWSDSGLRPIGTPIYVCDGDSHE